MKIKGIKCLPKRTKKTTVVLFIMFIYLFSVTTVLADGKVEVVGELYEFDKDSHYEFHENNITQNVGSGNTYGTFYISGDIVSVSEKSGIPSYEVVNDGGLQLFYNYTDTLLNEDKDSWHLIEDKSKKVSDISLESNISKGAIIIQTSKDRINWIEAETICNAFGDTPIRTSSIYSTTDVQLINGCFYRVIVVYELRIRTEKSNFLFINTDKFEYKKCAEIYEFYAYTDSGEAQIVIPGNGYKLGNKVRVKEHDGYYGEKEIKKGDLHYGDNGNWDLGNFFVSGYTKDVVDANGNVVFLKNVGDKVTLWFKLEQNINALDGNEKLSITADTDGYDQYFGTPAMNFGRGALIVRKTDHLNVQGEPTIYTNYLEANTSIGADTIVQLCEEGDYEVALNYEITSDELIDKIGHYRIFFKFSVRNSNCMIFPRDIVNGSELTNGSITENGFKLDYANSHYLNVNVKREVLKESADGLVEDTRFNRSAKDGAEFTDEGIYTITVKNAYNDEMTEKRIYVGTNNILRAYINNPNLTIPEINNLVANGATIAEDGTISLSAEGGGDSSSSNVPDDNNTTDESEGKKQPFVIMIFAGLIVCALAGILVIFIQKKKSLIAADNNKNDTEGGAE